MSDELEREPADLADSQALPRGMTRLVGAALHSPPPNPDAETAAQERALTAYENALRAPSPLHHDPWSPASGSLAARIGRFFRRLGG